MAEKAQAWQKVTIRCPSLSQGTSVHLAGYRLHVLHSIQGVHAGVVAIL
jgi:hypothetical protein